MILGKIFKTLFLFFLIIALLLILLFYFLAKVFLEPEKINWGVSFSQKHAQDLGLDWKEAYLAIIDELGVKRARILTHWDLIEKEKGQYDFADLDWQIQEAEKRKVELILVVGMKTGRWPECHIPDFAKNSAKEEQQEIILKTIEELVLRYKNSSAVKYWQVENEPFFPFGECPWYDRDFLDKEIAKVRELDNFKMPIIITESGEWSFWLEAAKRADMVGTTMYRKVFVPQIGIYFKSPLPSVFYQIKAKIINRVFEKKVISVELQAEPWGPVLLYDLPLREQEKTMNLEKFKENIEFAKATGLDEFYLWGAEWWYWLKEKQGSPEIWEEAKKLF